MAGSTHFGYWYRIQDKPSGPSFTSSYCPQKIPFGQFFNNSVHSTGRFGLWIFPGYQPTPTGACSDNTPSTALFSNLIAYGNDKGGEAVNANAILFKNFTVWDMHDTGVDAKIVRKAKDINTAYRDTFYNDMTGTSLTDSVFIGNSLGGASIGKSGATLTWDRGQLVKNVGFYNYPDAGSSAMDMTTITGTCS